MLTDSELRKLRENADRLEREAEDVKSEAREMAEEMRDEGVDPTSGEAFDTLDAKYREGDEKAQEAANLRDRYTRALEQRDGSRREGPADRGRDEVDARGESLGARFVNTDAYERFAQEIKRDVGSAVRNLGLVEVQSRDETRNLIKARSVDLGTGETLIVDDRESGITDPHPYRPVKVLDLISVLATDSDKIDYVAELAPTENADAVEYGSDPDTAPSLPESDYVLEERSASVNRVGHYSAATEAQIADAAGFQGFLDSRLRGGVRRKAESLVVSGDTASGDPFDGILNTAGIASIARDTTNDESRHDASHRAITQVRLNAFEEPQVIGLHPNDYEEIVLEKDANGNYLNGRGVVEPGTIWGLRTSVSPIFPEGTALVGRYSGGANMWVNEGVAVTASDSHSDWFTKGWVAIKAQMRAAFAVTRPVLFCEVTSF